MRLRRPAAPVTPPVIIDDEKRAQLAAVVLFGFTPTGRALTGWWPGELWLAAELEDFGVTSAAETRAG